MKKRFLTTFTFLLAFGLANYCFAANNTAYKINVKAPNISESLKPIIQKYRAENYLEAMFDLEELVKIEKNNFYAKYYLALCYTRLGFPDEAKGLYNEVAQSKENYALNYYANRALVCLENQESEECQKYSGKDVITTNNNEFENEEEQEEDDDITKFIKSGKKIHPEAADEITKRRMERKLMEYEQLRMKGSNNELGLSQAPTNEEIAQALNTLSRIGMNPFQMQNQGYDLASLNNPFYSNVAMMNQPMFNNMNLNTAQMVINSQLMQNQNDLMNYGI